MTMSLQAHALVTALKEEVAGPVLLPGDPGFDVEIAPHNLAISHHPVVAVGATGADDVRAAVRLAARARMQVAVQATGHGAVAPVEGGMLISTRRMNSVHVNPQNATASIGAGARWADVIKAAARHGLAPLSGSAADVGAIGYTLGGGLPIMGRTFGFAADQVRSLEVVTADGVARHVEADTEPELFWALRGGQGNLAIVTSLVTSLVPVTRVYAGRISYPGEAAARVLRAYRDWTSELPETVTSSLMLIRMPSLPGVPESQRGQFAAVLAVVHVGDEATGKRLLAPMRAAAPALTDTVTDRPYSEIDTIFNEAQQPLPYYQRCALLSDFTPEAADALLSVAGPAVRTPLLAAVVRHLGGAMARPPADGNAVGGRDADYLVFMTGLMLPDIAPIVPGVVDAAAAAMRPYSTGGTLVNCHGTPGDAADRSLAWPTHIYARLLAAKACYDPRNMFRSGHAIEPGASPPTVK